jgi:two-component system response regulator HydG
MTDPSSPRVLVVDDDVAHLAAVARLLRREGLVIDEAGDARAALDLQAAHGHRVVLTDLMMPGESGLELLSALQRRGADIDVIVMTAFGTIERAVEAMRAGAADFVVKPIERAALVRAVRRSLERARLHEENRVLRDELARLRASDRLVGDDPVFRAALRALHRVAGSNTTVLLQGESGTGKEVFARELHDASPRAAGPFVAVDCGALAESLAEAELFGHEPGAFTGATGRRRGHVESASGGTLFLDEIGELPLDLQVKLLRVLQEREVVRVGSSRPVPVDVRVVAATHRDLEEEVRAGRFREDLFYRLFVFPVRIPPLRERPGDVALLATHFVATLAPDEPRAISPAAQAALRGWGWPGNVRELRNAVERALIVDTDGVLDVDDLPRPLTSAAEGAPPESVTLRVGMTLAEAERLLIEATLRHVDGDKTLAATMLGVGRRTIYRRVDEYRDDD